MNLLTVRRAGDGVFHQASIQAIKERFMPLKCTFCVERNGDAVPTEQWFLVSTPTGDKIACMKCKEGLHGRKGDVNNTDTQPRRH